MTKKQIYRDSKAYTDRVLKEIRDQYDPIRVAIVHPVKENTIIAAQEAMEETFIIPHLVGPEDKIRAAADKAKVDISGWDIHNTEHSHESAEKACHLASEGTVQAIMKGNLHSDELLVAVIKNRSLRTERRISHVFAMDVKTYHKPFLITDAAINIMPDLKTKADIVQNAINLWHVLHDGDDTPKVALLAAVEVVSPDMPATIDAAALCKMADRKQIKDGILDGPLAFDNAISKDAAKIKGIESEVAGDPDILVAPDLEAANIMAKQMTFLSEAEAAGLVVGARVPVILTSRADSARTRLLSCAIAVKYHAGRNEGKIK